MGKDALSNLQPDETFIFQVTGSLGDVKYNPLYWILALATGGLFLLGLYFYRIFHRYTLTNQRLIIESGIFTNREDEVDLFRIVDSKVFQSLTDRMAGMGTIEVNSTDLTGTILMKKIPNCLMVRDMLRQTYSVARETKGTMMVESINSRGGRF